MTADQRYCLECGERRLTSSDFLRSGLPSAAPPPSSPPGAPPAVALAGPPADRSNTLNVIAGIGVLLLAMGVGVLIGRAGSSSRQTAPPAQVVTVGTGASTGSGVAEESFSDDWPSGTKGFTVQLQTLPQSATSVAAVTQAKSTATGKGASAVGALKSEDFSSLSAGSYVIYSGVFHKRTEAEHALSSLKKKFPEAKVISVSEEAAGGSQASGGSSKSSGGSGGSVGSKAAPPSVLEGESHAKGKSYEEQSKNLPDVVSTG